MHHRGRHAWRPDGDTLYEDRRRPYTGGKAGAASGRRNRFAHQEDTSR
jgi:hypothetical protein